MIRQTTPALRRATILAMVAALVAAVLGWSPGARAQATDDAETATQLTNAEFRWGLNRESSGKSHQPGAYNFMSAGDLLDVPSPVGGSSWNQSTSTVSIQKRDSAGSPVAASWADTQIADSGLEMVFSKGVGTIDPAAEEATIAWTGVATVVFYSGLVRMTISDPVLTVTPTKAAVTATMAALESDRDSTATTGRIAPRTVTIANLSRNCVDLAEGNGFSATPEFSGVKYEADDAQGEYSQVRTGDGWGAFPSSFMKLVSEAGNAGFWYSTSSDSSRKAPLPISVGWKVGASANPTGKCVTRTSGSGSQGVLGQVVDDTVEDILRAAGTDVSDTAAAWMDEAWKPLQPDAVKAAQQEGIVVAPADGTSTEVLVDEQFEEHFEEVYSHSAPITAGTVGATVSSIPATSSSGDSGGGNAPASSPAAPQAATPVAANPPLTEVAYARTSGSSETGNLAARWQWWVGGALLALAAGLFYQTVRRKD